jgi:Activator of Hsp90 ATPase homolog 1-like protein
MRSPKRKDFPNTGCYLEVVPNERLVWTDALLPGYRPSEKPFMTAMIALEKQGKGTRYTATAIHRDEAGKKQHENMGFPPAGERRLTSSWPIRKKYKEEIKVSINHRHQAARNTMKAWFKPKVSLMNWLGQSVVVANRSPAAVKFFHAHKMQVSLEFLAAANQSIRIQLLALCRRDGG